MIRDVLALSEDADTAMIAIEMLHGNVKHIPIVREGKVVGIVSRHDLVRLLTRPDAEIEADLRELLDRERLWAEPVGVSVTGGVAEVRGPADAQARRLIEVLARTVPGVIEVRFHD
jgi:CBS domain-containing protein